MEDMDFGQTSIDEATAISVDISTAISSDKSTEISIDDAHQTSIDSTPPEAGKYSLTDDGDERVVQRKHKVQLSNANNQIMNEKGTEIPVQIKSISERDNEWKLPLQDYLNPVRTYSNRSAIRLPKDDTKKFGISLEYFIMNQFGIYQIDDDILSELEQQIDFVDSQTLKNNYPNPDSLTQNYDATVGSRQGRAKYRLNQAFTGNRKLATDLNGKIDLIFSELTRKFDALINVVLLRSRKHLIPRAIEINNTEKHAVVEETDESRLRPIILDNPSTESKVPREKERPNTEEEAIDLEEEEGEMEEDAEIDRQERTNVDRQTTVNIDRHSGNNVDRLPTPAEPAVERVYRKKARQSDPQESIR
ncbi:hypothetical protein DY000_02007579 [Brassica cretica]|uniref:Uncharacterized protein n=1 Tax=Brassica cretica TaxID=69181 RepID=A0ABQ7C6Y8_BRACR|nr:hypothetical protein DY000_02007579 [Brassica cretica]